MPGELWMEVHHIVQETGIKTIPKKKKCKKAKWLSEEALQIAVKRRKTKTNGANVTVRFIPSQVNITVWLGSLWKLVRSQ